MATERGTKDTFRVQRGDLIRHTLAGGGGWGDPLEREPEKVLADFVAEKVSLEKARELYAAIIDPNALQIDQRATQALRADRKRQGGEQK